ncbi:MAG: OmpA family protein [Halobacteria archaeon]|nr:OmpA family protein [Halobacteria archaeon]
MIKHFRKTGYPYVLLASLPLLVLGGCASQETTSPVEDTATPATEINKPISKVQDPIAILEAHASEFDTERSDPVAGMNEDVQPATSSADASDSDSAAIKPQEQLIGFAFDQAEVDEQYHELLKHHAQYLSENQDMKLKVNGHTDSFGPKEYNQYLSKKRAEAVAKLLVGYGAPEDQIMIEGNADEEPLISATHHSEHRRVELDYQDQRLVSYE